MKLRSFLFAFLCSLSLHSYTQPPTISFPNAITGLTTPVDVVNAGDGSNRLFIAQQAGVVRIWANNTLTDFFNVGSSPGLNLIRARGVLGDSEEGLLSIAFHPDYDGVNNRQFFIYYTDLNGDIAIRRFQTQVGNANAVEAGNGTLLLTIPHPIRTNHNGGKLLFGPDGFLYISTGDGGGSNDPDNNAQNGNSLLGKLLRIDVNNTSAFGEYAVPANNPYVTNPAVDDRIFAMGLRNPFRFSFDRLNGNIWIGDVGQDAREEISFIPSGTPVPRNFGWRCYEGQLVTVNPCAVTNYNPPVYDYAHGSGGQSVTGGYVYRGPDYPTLRGYYLAADVYKGDIYILWPNGSGGWNSAVQPAVRTGIVGFGEGEDGTLYAVSQFSNNVHRVEASGGVALPARLSDLRATRRNGANEIAWKALVETEVKEYGVQYSSNGTSFNTVGSVPAGSTNGQYNFRHIAAANEPAFYRLEIKGTDQSVSYSQVLRLNASGGQSFNIYPTLLQTQSLMLTAGKPAQRLQVNNSMGAALFNQQLGGFTGVRSFSLPSLLPGVYWITIVGADGERYTQRVLVQ